MAKAESAGKGDKGDNKAASKVAGPIRVKAVALGFYENLRRRPGAIFTIKNEKEFSKNWMVRLTTKPAPAVEVEEVAGDAPAVQEESVI